LDEILQGGLPKGSLSLILGAVGSGKSILARQFLYQGSFDGCPSILVSTADTPDDLTETARGFGWNLSLVDSIYIVDCYSWKTKKTPLEYSAKSSNP
jgi:circadian clock protein KaiC